jgi:hypothetical protein
MKRKVFFKKSLSILSMSFLILGTVFASDLSALETQHHEDNAQTIKDDEGNIIQIKPDGSKLIKKADGTSVEIKADGSKSIHEANGTSIELKADGSKTIKKADGSIIEVKPGHSS